MQNAKLLSTPALADLARADRLSRKLGRGPVISVPRQWLYIENIHCKKEQSWQNHWVEQLDAFTWALRECLATHWYASKKDDVHDQFCLLLQEICLLAVFPVDVPTEWVFVLGRPEMRECVPISHTPNWRRQERRKWRYRFRWVRAFLLNQSTGIYPLTPRNDAAEYDFWCTSPSPAWFNPRERILTPCDPWVLRYPLRMKPVLVVGGTHPEHSCREREVIILGEADGFVKWVPEGHY